ncbi:MAG: VWA domain-containing protein [Pseudomonadota bacterium]
MDLSASGRFGTVKQLKNEVAAEVCALLAFAAVKNNDKVGMIVFTDQVEMFIPPQKGTRHVLRVIREILWFKASQSKTDLALALDYLGKVCKRRAVVFLISDFQDEGFERQLRALGRHHDLIAVAIRDPKEVGLPDVGLIELEDAETGETILIDSSSPIVRSEYQTLTAQNASNIANIFRSIGIDQIDIETGRPYVLDLVNFFRAREKGRQRKRYGK